MKDNKVFLIAGGDMRQLYAAKKLAEKYKTYIYGFENVIDTGKAEKIDDTEKLHEKIGCLVLPLPVSTDNVCLNAPHSRRKLMLSSLKNAVSDDTVITGGRVTQEINALFGRNVTDYSLREDFAVANAVPTAEAAVEIAMQNFGRTIYKAKVLIVGAGRIAKVLAKILNGFGAQVTVAARKKTDLIWSEIYGCKAAEISKLEESAEKADIIFNTAPAKLVDKSVLDRMKNDAFVIDLASKPGGTDFEYAQKRDIKALLSLSLPGKYSPVTAGEIIAQTTLNILTERSFPE